VGLECSECGKNYDAAVNSTCVRCGRPLLARYDLKRAAKTLSLNALANRQRTLWRYAEVLPDGAVVSLGEG
jgi:threonine synthase